MVITSQDRAAARRVACFFCDRAGVLIAVALLAGTVVGCGRRGLPGTVPVEGTVTFGGGGCPAVGCVYFLPANGGDATAGTQPRAGWARFEKDGQYRATTLVTNDGLLPGTYTVRVECHAVAARPTGHEAGDSLVPASATLPPLVVPAGIRKAIRFDIDIVAGPDGASNAGS